MEEERRKEGREEIHYNNTVQRTFIDISGSLGIVPHCWEAAPESLEAKLSLCYVPFLLFGRKRNPAAGIVDCGFERACLFVGKEEKKEHNAAKNANLSGN